MSNLHQGLLLNIPVNLVIDGQILEKGFYKIIAKKDEENNKNKDNKKETEEKKETEKKDEPVETEKPKETEKKDDTGGEEQPPSDEGGEIYQESWE